MNQVLGDSKVGKRGDAQIPVAVRQKLGLKSGDRVVFVERNGKVFVQKWEKPV